MSNSEATGPKAPDKSTNNGGNDAVQQALDEVASAEAQEVKAEEKLEEALQGEKRAEQKLEQAEVRLEEALRHEVIRFEVDGEPCKTKQPEWTPDAIIKDFGERDPATNYLIRLGQDHDDYKDKGAIPITIHEGDRFQIIPTGPAPVSDGTKRTGMQAFVAGLKDLGFDPVPLPDKADHVYFDYAVPCGKYEGQKFRIGFVVPSDFPLSAPGGIHVSPRIHPNRGGNKVHPLDGIQDSAEFQKKAGGEWHYWSRPDLTWGTTKKTVTIYMGHVYRLWETQ